jgi:hypothetical protein
MLKVAVLDVMVLDLGLPDEDGLGLGHRQCRQLAGRRRRLPAQAIRPAGTGSTPAHAVAASGGAQRQPDRTRPFDHNRRMGKPYPCASEVHNGQRRLTDINHRRTAHEVAHGQSSASILNCATALARIRRSLNGGQTPEHFQECCISGTDSQSEKYSNNYRQAYGLFAPL